MNLLDFQIEFFLICTLDFRISGFLSFRILRSFFKLHWTFIMISISEILDNQKGMFRFFSIFKFFTFYFIFQILQTIRIFRDFPVFRSFDAYFTVLGTSSIILANFLKISLLYLIFEYSSDFCSVSGIFSFNVIR